MKPEVWLRGPLPDTSALLQPIVQALLQAREEVNELMADFPDERLWKRPAGLASVGFHLQHLAGVLDRLLTYARAEPLSQEQLIYLSAEGEYVAGIKATTLVAHFNRQLDRAVAQIKATSESTLTDYRSVGRGRLPSTVMGLLTHAAEHTMRHLGQLLVTVRVVAEPNGGH